MMVLLVREDDCACRQRGHFGQFHRPGRTLAVAHHAWAWIGRSRLWRGLYICLCKSLWYWG